MPKILAERLRAEAEKRGLTQEDLAGKAGISREQCGKQLRKKGSIRINEKTARGYEKVFGLSREELSTPPQVDKGAPSGWNRVVVPLSDEELLILRLTAMRYGMDGRNILRMSAALFVTVAELQLADRAKRLATAEAQIDSFPDGFDHLADAITGIARIEEALSAEKISIEDRDLTGSTLSDDQWADWFKGNSNLFEGFLGQMLEDLAPDIYEIDVGPPASNLFQDQIEELTQRDALARMVLLKGDVHPRELANISPKDRVAFLHGRCSEATREAHEELEAIFANVEIDLPLGDVAEGGQDDA